jgi:ribosome-associated protein
MASKGNKADSWNTRNQLRAGLAIPNFQFATQVLLSAIVTGMRHENPEELVHSGPSKSERKRQMQALQELGEELVALSHADLAALGLPEELYQAVLEARRIRQKHSAFRRQRQFIGKLMRQVDVDPIRLTVAKLDAGRRMESATFHCSEQWRERLLASDSALSDFIGHYPETDRQHLRQLLKRARHERQTGAGKGGARALFRFLHETIRNTETVSGRDS